MNSNQKIVKSQYGDILINTNDCGIGKFISETQYWASDDLALIKSLIDFQLIDPSKKVIKFYDIGSNIGSHTLALSKIFGDKIQIRAFEAQKEIFDMMKTTMTINNCPVICHHNAISDQANITLNIALPDYNKNNNFGGLEILPPIHSDNFNMVKSGFEEVKTVNIDSFDEPVDFIKIDIEGMENKAIMGGQKTIEKYRPICFIEIYKTDKNFVLNFFKNLHYMGFLKKPGQDLIVIPDWWKIMPDEFAKQMVSIDRVF